MAGSMWSSLDFRSAQPTHLTAAHPGLRARTLERGAGAKAAMWDSSVPGEDQRNLPGVGGVTHFLLGEELTRSTG